MRPVELETQRLSLVPLSCEHLPFLAPIYADPDVNRYIGGQELDLASTARQITSFQAVWQERGYGQSAVLHRESGRFLAGSAFTLGRSGTRLRWAGF